MAMSARIMFVIFTICASIPRAKGELEDWGTSGHSHLSLSPQDWYAASYKWQLLRAKVLAIGDYPSQSNRSRIWTHFRNIHAKDFKFKGDDVKAAELKEFVKSVDTIEAVGVPVTKIINNRWFERKIVYDQQVIAIMEDDRVVENAALSLYNKHPEISAIVKWNPNTQRFEQLKGNVVDEIGPRSRIQVVGHGRSKNGKMLLAGMNGKELAAALNTLPRKNEIGRISLVGCNIAQQPVKKEEDFLSNLFLKDFLKTLRSIYHIETTVSARTSLVQVDTSGRKYTAEITPDGIDWHNKDPKNKVVAEFDNDNNVVYRKAPVTENGPVYPCRDCKSLGDTSTANTESEIKNLVVLHHNAKTKKATYYIPVEWKDMDKYLNQNTKKTFIEEIDQFLGKALGLNPPEITWKSLKGHSVEIREKNTKGGSRVVNVGAEVVTHENVYYFNPKSKAIEKKTLKVREIQNYKQLVEDINWLGLLGVKNRGQAADRYEYYRYGDWVISFNLENFYAGDHFVGRISDRSEVELPDNVKNELTQNSEGIRDQTYAGMRKRLSKEMGGKKYQILNAKDWIVGKNDHVILRKPRVEEACLTLALFVSESCRNFRTHVINMLGIDMIENNNLQLSAFLDNHPMARGGSWPDRRKTGFRGLNDENIEVVRPLELSSVRLWLQGRSVKIESSKFICKDRDEVERLTSDIPKMDKSCLSKSKNSNFEFIGAIFGYEISPDSYEDQLTELGAVGGVGPLGENVQTQGNKIDVLGKDLMMSLGIKQDLIYVEHEIIETIKEQISDGELKNVKILEDSLEMKGDRLTFKVIKDSEDSPIELSCKIEPEKLQSNEMLEKINTHISEKGSKKPSKVAQIHEDLNTYFTLTGIAGSINALEEGDTVDGAVNLAQSLYGVSDMLKINERVFRMAGKGLGKLLSKSFSKVSKVAVEDTAKLVSEGVSGVIGLGFSIYNIVEDFKKHSTIGYIDGALDITIAITDLIGPAAEPVSIALLVVRLGIDDFYNDFKKELDSLPPDATFSQTTRAVFQAIGEATFDLFKEVNVFGQIYEAIVRTKKIKEGHANSENLVNTLSDASNYYKIQKEIGGKELINFVNGTAALKGGSIVFRLLDNGHAILTLKDVPDSSGSERELTQNITCNVKDIVLGIGESVSLTWEEEKAKVLWFITVYSADIISKETNLTSSLCGTYYGNSQDNRFYAVQKLPDSEQSMLSYSLSQYFYYLYGGDGDDTFFLGPQKSHVQGGEGRDSYIIPSYGGLVEIDNYAQDGINDYLFLDIVFSRIRIDRIDKNLVLGHETSHSITIQNWFKNASYQHLIFKTNDGILFEVSNTVLNQPTIHAIGIDRSNASKSDNHVIDTSSLPIWGHVRIIIGSNFSDTLIGNNQNNDLNGRLGENLLRGGPGADKYSITEGGGCDTVDNYATDGINDMLSLNITFDKIKVNEVAKKSLQLSNNDTCVTISQWFVNDSYRHLTGMSSDGVLFKINTIKTSQVVLVAILIDYEAKKEPQTMNLSAHVQFNTVTGIVGSPFNDVITGNSKGNYFAGKKGNDTVEGGLGSDVYVLHEGDGYDTIINKAVDQKQDLLLFGCSYDNITVRKEGKDLVINACSHPPASTTSVCEANGTMFGVRLQNWFENVLYQHLVVKSIDEVLFKLPTKENDTFFKMPVEIDRTKFKANVMVNATLDKWKTVQEIIGSNTTNSTLIGNGLNNVLQVRGPSSYLEGCNGTDVYQIYSGNVSIQNFARDNKTDTLQLQEDFLQIAVQQHDKDLIIRSMKNSSRSNHTVNCNVTVLAYKNSTEHQHLIGTTMDGIGFFFDSITFKPRAYMIDKHLVRGRLVINLGENYTWVNVTKVYGASDGPNHLIANTNPVSLKGGKYCDLLEGHNGNDVIKGDGGEDLIDGGFGDDILVGGPGPDWMLGSVGDDLLYPGDGADRVDGGLGSDTVIFQGDSYNRTGVLVDLLYGQGYSGDAMDDVYMNIENIIGSQFNDVLVGTDGNNVVKGRGGDDFLYPHDGHDLLAGNDGTDVYILHRIFGVKIIDNFAKDNSTDVLYMEDRKKESIRFTKNKNDLMIHVGDIYGWSWCPVDDFAVQITDWFKGGNNQHLSLFLDDKQLSCQTLQNITRRAPKSLHRSFWNKLVCGACRFGIGKIVAIVAILIVHILMIYCVSQNIGVAYRKEKEP